MTTNKQPYNYKMVPEEINSLYTAIVLYEGNEFARVPMTFAMPCKEYIVVMAAIDKVFSGFNDEMRAAFGGEFLGGFTAMLRGQLDEATCDELVCKSDIMARFSINYSLDLDKIK